MVVVINYFNGEFMTMMENFLEGICNHLESFNNNLKKSMIKSRMKFNHELGQGALKHGFKKIDGSPDIEAYKKHLDDICEKIDSIIRKY